jgi:hypothetical protein
MGAAYYMPHLQILKHLARTPEAGSQPEVVLLAQDDLDLARALKVGIGQLLWAVQSSHMVVHEPLFFLLL